jgi:tripartite-type tricarboxylate transporter receptor subunit TctC
MLRKWIKRSHPVVLYMTLAIILSVGASETEAQNYPAKEVELIISYAAGGSTDTMSRIMGNKVSQNLGVPVVFINKTGGGGAIAASAVLSAKPDGYTVGTASASNFGTLLATSDKIPYTLKDFVGIARGVTLPLMIVVKKGRFENFEGFIKEAKGKSLTYGAWGLGSVGHFVGELLNQALGIKMKHVPFDGGSKALVAVLGGHIDVGILIISTPASNVRAGLLTPLAIANDARVDEFPDVRTLKELGYPEANLMSYDGFVANPKVPKERLAILSAAFEKSIKDPEVQKAIRQTGMIPAFLSGRDYETFMEKNLEIFKKVAKDAGIKQ